MAKKGDSNKGGRKDENKSRKWAVIALAALFALVMIAVPLSVLINPPAINTGNAYNYAAEKPFSSIEDGLGSLPTGAQYVRYVDLEASSSIRNWSMTNISSSLPSPALFGAQAKKDQIAVYLYPQFGFYRMPGTDLQVVSMADFGKGFDNKSYSTIQNNGMTMRSINDNYAFSPNTYPTIHGMPQSVAAVEDFMINGGQSSAYGDYSDLFDQIASYPQTARSASFAVVGDIGSLGWGDKYYAGITPTNGTANYKIVVHLNTTLNETVKQAYKSQWSYAALYVYHFDYYNVQFTDNYLIVDASASPKTCLDDLYNNWPGFLRG